MHNRALLAHGFVILMHAAVADGLDERLMGEGPVNEAIRWNFANVTPSKRLGIYCWDQVGVPRRQMKNVLEKEIWQGLRNRSLLPEHLVYAKKKKIAIKAIPLGAMNMFPTEQGFLPTLHIAREMDVDLKTVDFLVSGSDLYVFASQQLKRGVTLLAQKCPTTSIIAIHSKVLDPKKVGIPERILAGQRKDDPRDLRKFVGMALIKFGQFTALCYNEVDGLDENDMPIKFMTEIRPDPMKLLFQMMASGSWTSIMGDRDQERDPKELRDLEVRTFAELATTIAQTGQKEALAKAERHIVEAFEVLKYKSRINASAPKELGYNDADVLYTIPHSFEPDFFPSSNVVSRFLNTPVGTDLARPYGQTPQQGSPSMQSTWTSTYGRQAAEKTVANFLGASDKEKTVSMAAAALIAATESAENSNAEAKAAASRAGAAVVNRSETSSSATEYSAAKAAAETARRERETAMTASSKAASTARMAKLIALTVKEKADEAEAKAMAAAMAAEGAASAAKGAEEEAAAKLAAAETKARADGVLTLTGELISDTPAKREDAAEADSAEEEEVKEVPKSWSLWHRESNWSTWLEEESGEDIEQILKDPPALDSSAPRGWEQFDRAEEDEEEVAKEDAEKGEEDEEEEEDADEARLRADEQEAERQDTVKEVHADQSKPEGGVPAMEAKHAAAEPRTGQMDPDKGVLRGSSIDKIGNAIVDDAIQQESERERARKEPEKRARAKGDKTHKTAAKKEVKTDSKPVVEAPRTESKPKVPAWGGSKTVAQLMQQQNQAADARQAELQKAERLAEEVIAKQESAGKVIEPQAEDKKNKVHAAKDSEGKTTKDEPKAAERAATHKATELKEVQSAKGRGEGPAAPVAEVEADAKAEEEAEKSSQGRALEKEVAAAENGTADSEELNGAEAATAANTSAGKEKAAAEELKAHDTEPRKHIRLRARMKELLQAGTFQNDGRTLIESPRTPFKVIGIVLAALLGLNLGSGTACVILHFRRFRWGGALDTGRAKPLLAVF